MFLLKRSFTGGQEYNFTAHFTNTGDRKNPLPAGLWVFMGVNMGDMGQGDKKNRRT